MSDPRIVGAVADKLEACVGVRGLAANVLAQALIAEYERTVPSDRLQAILSERRHAVNEMVQPSRPFVGRWEARNCKRCGKPILPGQAYAVNGPEHIGCRRQSLGG